MTTAATVDLVGAQRRTLRTLVVAQAVGALGMTIGVATASLLARDISGSESQAGFAQTFQVLGTAISAYLLARVMTRRGRRVGLVGGYLVGAAGAVLAVAAGVVGSMTMLLVGAVLIGSTSAANNASRYAATDLAEDAHKARSLSIVVWASTIGAVLGPNLTGPAGALAAWVGIPELTGPFALGAIGMLAAALVLAVRLRPDPLLLAREAAGVPVQEPSGTAWRRAVDAMRQRPVLAFAVLAMACAHAAMVGIMIMTPLHMEHGHAELEVIGLVISIHVLGMFAFAPLVGLIADRAGRPAAVLVGAVLLLAAAALCAGSPEGSSWQIVTGLFVLGLGWSFVTVAASTLIAQHAPLEVRTDVQGTSDLLMSLTAAGAGAAAGLVVDVWGYRELSVVSVGLVALVAIGGLGARATTRLAG